MTLLTTDDIKQTVKMTDLLDRYGIRHNKNKALCPFHDEKTPSFSVKGIMFHCFGCSVGGDIFNFVQRMENCDFKEAVKILGGGKDFRRPRIRRPTEAQRKQKNKEHIAREWLNCVNYVRGKALPVFDPAFDIDLSTLDDQTLNNLCNADPEYVRQLHRLPYLEYLVFEGADT